MIRSLLIAIFLLGTLLQDHAQDGADAAQASVTGSITGTVVKEPGSQALKKVLIQVVAENQKEGGNYTALSDADGHFHIEHVANGRYRLFTEKNGFIGINDRGLRSETRVITIQAGQSVDNLILRMIAAAVISGRVTDEDGDPMPGVRVVGLKRVPGKARRQAIGTEATNDLGEYRLAGLVTGQYWIVAMPSPDFRDYEQQDQPTHDDSSNNKPGDAKQDTRYLATYYPGTYDAAQAAALTLKAGDDITVNFTLVPARAYRVRGMVSGIAPGQKPVVELVSQSGDSIHAIEVRPDGQFEVRGVGPGSYELRATSGADSQPLTARQEVSVVSGDVEGLKLVPQPSLTISGHLQVEGGEPGALTLFNANLRSAEAPEDAGFFMSQEFFGTNAPLDRHGDFEWKQVTSGDYIVRVFGGDGRGFFVKSVRLGGRDVETGFTANGPTSIDVTVSFESGTIEGTVVEKEKDVDQAKPVPNAMVVAVPEEKYRKSSDRFGVGESDQHGRFTIRGLAPGKYRVYAWQDVDESVYREEEFLKSQEPNGTAVKVSEGSEQTVELKLSSVGEEWR